VSGPDAVERALELARAGLAAPESTIERVRSRVLAHSLRTPGELDRANAGALPQRGSGVWAAFKATGVAGLIAAVALVGAGFAAGLVSGLEVRDLGARGEVVPAELAPVASHDDAPLLNGEQRVGADETGVDGAEPPQKEPLAEAAPAATPQPHTTRRRAPVHRSPAAVQPNAREELALLARAERALRRKDASLALALLAELEQRFPATALAEERTAARWMAHCLQHPPHSEKGIIQFLNEHPDSVYASRLRALCAGSLDSVQDIAGRPTDARLPDTTSH
jgi:hypothetical protein